MYVYIYIIYIYTMIWDCAGHNHYCGRYKLMDP